MKKTIFTLSACLIVSGLFAQIPLTETQKLASLCKVWGFLKYYNPEVAKGKLDWDKALMDHIGPVSAAGNRQELDHIYMNWISDLKTVKHCQRCGRHIPDSMKMTLDLKWMDDKSLFSDSISSMLHFMEQNKRGSRNYYVRKKFPQFTISFRNEEHYEDSVPPSYDMRLLALFRYWNIIQYYFPHKNIIGEDWNKVLDEMIPVFEKATDTFSYYRALGMAISRTNDSHGYLLTPKSLLNFWKTKTPAFKYKIIDQKAIVTGFYNDTLAQLDDIRYGDVILKVNDNRVADIIAAKSKLVAASNDPTKLDRLSNFMIVTGYQDTMQITFDRAGITSTKTIHRYLYSQFHYDYKKKDNDEPYKMLNDTVGYVDMGVLKPKQVKETMKSMAHTSALIFDVRNYPNGTNRKLAKHLNSEHKPFVKFTQQSFKHPGMFKTAATYKCGKRNKHNYKGKVIVLMNETTQSHAEFTVMTLQTAPNVTCIGSQTAGADGDVAKIPLPGGYSTYMTGLGVFYPDGRPTQRIGIVPDIKVTPTIEGLRQHKDEVQERAISYITTGK